MDKKSNGVGFPGILTIIFVIAKLFGVIDWSWWLVFAPAIVSVSLGLIILLVLFIVAQFVE